MLKLPFEIKIIKNMIKGNILDIFIIGSSIKNKLSPRDIDLIVLFKEKNLENIQNSLYEIKESLNVKNLHIEPLFAESMFKEKIFLTILHEGISIKETKKVADIINLASFLLISFSLNNLNKTDKVKFAHALYGREKKGLLYSEEGRFLGQGSIMVPIEKEEIFKDLLKKWKVSYSSRRIFVNN